MTAATAPSQRYIYRWNRQGRKGHICTVTARGKMNSISVRFADGYTMVTSANAIAKVKP
ncbi:MAG: hypothetical protein ACSHXI_05745 [Hoeflea sp.]|uniref:hypothetical protein n=1 Tax=Hoeflea sp. TaxID=1940281 RepID=UPI003EF8C779